MKEVEEEMERRERRKDRGIQRVYLYTTRNGLR